MTVCSFCKKTVPERQEPATNVLLPPSKGTILEGKEGSKGLIQKSVSCAAIDPHFGGGEWGGQVSKTNGPLTSKQTTKAQGMKDPGGRGTNGGAKKAPPRPALDSIMGGQGG